MCICEGELFQQLSKLRRFYFAYICFADRKHNVFAQQVPEDNPNDCRPTSSIKHGKLVGYVQTVQIFIFKMG